MKYINIVFLIIDLIFFVIMIINYRAILKINSESHNNAKKSEEMEKRSNTIKLMFVLIIAINIIDYVMYLNIK